MLNTVTGGWCNLAARAAIGHQTGYEDVFTKLDMCRAHYAAFGLGADYVERFVR